MEMHTGLWLCAQGRGLCKWILTEDDLHKDDQDIADEEGDLDVAGTSKNKRKRKCSKEKDVTFLDEGRGDYVEKQMFHAKQVNILKCNYFLLI